MFQLFILSYFLTTLSSNCPRTVWIQTWRTWPGWPRTWTSWRSVFNALFSLIHCDIDPNTDINFEIGVSWCQRQSLGASEVHERHWVIRNCSPAIQKGPLAVVIIHVSFGPDGQRLADCKALLKM